LALCEPLLKFVYEHGTPNEVMRNVLSGALVT